MDWSDVLIYGVYGSVTLLGLAIVFLPSSPSNRHRWHEVDSAHVAMLARNRKKGKNAFLDTLKARAKR